MQRERETGIWRERMPWRLRKKDREMQRDKDREMESNEDGELERERWTWRLREIRKGK